MHYATFVRCLMGYTPRAAWLYRLHPSYAESDYIIIFQHGWGIAGHPSDEDGMLLSERPVFWFHDVDPDTGVKKIGYAV
jgi:hypothetical protein